MVNNRFHLKRSNDELLASSHQMHLRRGEKYFIKLVVSMSGLLDVGARHIAKCWYDWHDARWVENSTLGKLLIPQHFQGRRQGSTGPLGARALLLGKSGSTSLCPWEHFFEEISKFLKK